MDYLLKASGLIILFFLFYYIFLKNETFFKSIRSYFLIGLIVAVSIPLVEIPVYIEAVTKQFNSSNFNTITNAPIIEQSFDWIQLLTFTYLAGIVFFSLKFLLQLISLAFLLSKHELNKKGKYYFIETSKNISPFSFFNIIIYNKSQFSIDELAQIINHEKAHAIQWHSLDTILAHLLVITLWFNPFVWLYKKAVQQNLEFLADAYALQKANNHKLYKLTLLKTCSSNYCTEITNNFYNSLIKKRIIMLHKNKSKNRSQWKYALLLPALIAFIFIFNTKIVAQDHQLIEVEEQLVELIIDKNTNDGTLSQETATFKNEFDISLSFKGIKRNAKNEITAIKITAKGNNVKANFANSGSEPIQSIKITYDSGKNSISIGNIGKPHKEHYSYTIHKDHKGKPNKDGNFVFVTSDGEVNTWTSKSSDTIIHENKIIIKESEGEHVWVHKGDDNVNIEVIEINNDGKKTVKILKEPKEVKEVKEVKEKKYNIKIIEEGDDNNTSENVFIIKSDKQGNDHTKTGNTLFMTTDSSDKPLIILDGKEISSEEMEKIKPDNIESINVLKGDSAIKKYGEKAKNGVIEITKKK